MKYIEIYLNERQKELEKAKEEYIKQLKKEYEKCTVFDDFINDIDCNYSIIINGINIRLNEIKKLKDDLLGSDKE